MSYSTIDLAVIIAYFAILMFVGWWKGRGKQASSGAYFFSRGTLPWWAIGCAYAAAGMNTEQLIGQNGMGYTVGLTVVNWYYTIVPIVYGALIFFFPVYLRSKISTLPEYLGRRFDDRSKNVFAILLLVSYIFLNLAVVFYGGARVLHGVFGWSFMGWMLVLAFVAGFYTMYGGMSSMTYTAVAQFVLIVGAGFVLFFLAYNKLPNGWSDVVTHSPGGFHLFQPMDYDVIPWHAIPLTLLGLHLFYSCTNQAMVQRGFGAKTEWDARLAIIFVGFFVFLRPFIEIFPGMIARALAFMGHSEFDIGITTPGASVDVDMVFPMLINNLVPAGLKGLIVAGILSSVMSTISAFLNSISTLITFDVYKKWIRKDATDKQLVRVGVIATLVLMAFGVLYSPVIGLFGGIFMYFQAFASYLAVPIATVFLFGIFWKRATPTAAFVVMVAGIPIGAVVSILMGGIPIAEALPWTASFLPLFSQEAIDAYSLDNFFVGAGVTQAICILLLVGVSLVTKPKPVEEIAPVMWAKKMLRLPEGEPKRHFLASSGFWWVMLLAFYAVVVIYLR